MYVSGIIETKRRLLDKQTMLHITGKEALPVNASEETEPKDSPQY